MKKLHISDSAAAELACLAVTAKVFSGVLLDCPELLNSDWISPLIGQLIFLPAAVVLSVMERVRRNADRSAMLETFHPVVAWFILIITIAVTALDAALTVVNVGTAASYIAIGNVTTFYLLLPQFALCIWCILFGGNAIGNAARIWSKLLLAIIAVVAILVMPRYRPAWLTPVLGPGVKSILSGAFRCAGWYSLLIPAFLLSEKESSESQSGFHPVRTTLISGFIVVALLVLYRMLSPALIHENDPTRFARLDSLLSNGRLSLGLQLPMIVLWFTSQLFLLLYDTWIVSAAVQKVAPRLKKIPCVVFSVGAIVLLAFSGWCTRTTNQKEGLLLFPIFGILLIITALPAMPRKGNRHA